MLSRSPSIHRTPGESPSTRPAPVRPPTERGVGDAVLKGRVWRRTLLLVVLAGMLVSVLLSNTNGVVDPQFRVLNVRLTRPGLLPVLLLTSLLSVACTVAFRAAVHARRQAAEVRGVSLTARVEDDASRIKHALVPPAVRMT
jgi:hypothetical protein